MHGVVDSIVLDRLTSTEHLLDELAVKETAILVSNAGGLLPLSLSELVAHSGQSAVELISIDLTSVAGIEDAEGTNDGGLIVGLTDCTTKIG